jgi:hypothetical protein
MSENEGGNESDMEDVKGRVQNIHISPRKTTATPTPSPPPQPIASDTWQLFNQQLEDPNGANQMANNEPEQEPEQEANDGQVKAKAKGQEDHDILGSQDK